MSQTKKVLHHSPLGVEHDHWHVVKTISLADPSNNFRDVDESKSNNYIKDQLENFNSETLKTAQQKAGTVHIEDFRYHVSDAKSALHSNIKDLVSHTNDLDKWRNVRESDARHFEPSQTQYKTGVTSKPQDHPRLYLENPPSRRHTSHNKISKFPCSGGIKGPAHSMEAGAAVAIEWQIQNPSHGGK